MRKWKTMTEWKQMFGNSTLERGKASYLNKRVADLTETDGMYRAAVLGRERYEVSIRVNDDGMVRMRCSCALARSGSKCEHMAAVWYAIEAGKRAKEEKIDEAVLMELWRKTDDEARRETQEEQAEKTKVGSPRKAAVLKAAKKAEKADSAAAKMTEKAAAAAIEIETDRSETQTEEARCRSEKEQEERRLAREQRKAERARRKEEQKRQAEEARRLENEKRLAEEARREKIRQQKAEEARIKAEKRQREQEEARRLAEERCRREQEEQKLAEERCRQERKEQMSGKKEYGPKSEIRQIREAQRRTHKQRKEEFQLLGEAWPAEDDSETRQRIDNMAELEEYSYYRGTRIKNSMIVSKNTYARGEKLLREGKLRIDEIQSGFDRSNSEALGQIIATGTEGKEEFSIRAIFSRTEVVGLECGCSKCQWNYGWFYKKINCAYSAGVLSYLEKYLNTHNLGDVTDQGGNFLLFAYRRKRARQVMADTMSKKESLTLLPRLIKKDNKLLVSFRVGENKLFVVKKLDEFCQNVKNSETSTYGNSTEINHSPENFTEEGRKWIRYIDRLVQDEEEIRQRLEEDRYYYGKIQDSIGGEVNLTNWRLDEFYRLLGDKTVDYEDRDEAVKKKRVLSCAISRPKVTIHISEEKLEGGSRFHGIRVEGKLPRMYFGTVDSYYIGENNLFQTDREFLEKMEPLTELAKNGTFSLRVGRNSMSEFYYRVLPELADIAEITETEPDKFRSFLMPEARFVFYLDMEDGNAVCEVYACYGEQECNVLDILQGSQRGEIESFRDADLEEEVLFQTLQWFPEEDRQLERLYCGEDEERVYEAVTHGVEKLMELGEVHVTERFRKHRTGRHLKVSVGVSVESGLLELDILTEGVPQDELLDILNGYRAKKKYYRLKDGSFVDLEESSLEMLSELMEAAHLKPKEFVQGKMHLPMYRTLYLDKLLEEHEDIYSNRDRHFKEVIKGFKTVKDADFEEPENLSRIMRKYQKDGYKWLRTLEVWKFGGILADDMGLGKTLQVISVLLAAKQEGREGTALVVAPASLIFNWGEEFRRFAPELRVSIVAGTQELRQEAIAAYRESDVLITSYDLLKRDILYYEDKTFSYEIIDEAQYIKNHTTAAAKAVKVIHSDIRYALTGTPIENRLSELWSIFDYLMPGFLYGYDVFKREIETPVVKYEDAAAMKRLQKMVGPFILRRVKEDVLKDLPEKLEECRYVQFGSAQQKLYDGQVVHMKETIACQDDAEFGKNKLQILGELTRLRQICCDPALCFENYRGEAAKLEACMELIESAIDGGHRMLVFSQFTSMLEILQRRLDEAGIPYYTIMGSTSKEKRLQLVRDFNEGDTPVFLISLKAGGVGLNLTGADVVIHYDPWWNLAAQNQATDRAHRIGQEKRVTVYKLIAKNTIEEKIRQLQETKKNLADQVIGGEMGQLGVLSKEEIMDLLDISS